MHASSSRAGRPSVARSLLRLARPSHWVKNAFVLAPLLFTFRSADPASALRAVVAAVAFSLASSAVYAVNDVLDRHRDRRSPEKRERPVASGALSPRAALAFAACSAAAAFGLCLALPPIAGATIAGYVALQAAYSWRLKEVVLLDVMVIAAGFILRVAAGAAAMPVALSPWMVHVTLFLSLFLGFAKRRHEIAFASRRGGRAVLGSYSTGVLDLLVAVAAALTIVTYALYVIQPAVVSHLRTDSLIWTVPLVVYGILRYLFLVVRRDRGGDVAEVVWRDRALRVDILLWTAAVVLLSVLAP